jgi:hypothetical protein
MTSKSLLVQICHEPGRSERTGGKYASEPRPTALAPHTGGLGAWKRPEPRIVAAKFALAIDVEETRC